MFDYEYIHSELKDHFIGTTDTVVPTEQLEKLYDAFTEKFPDVETKEDYNTIDPDAFIDFIRNFCESEDGIPFYALKEGDVDGTGLVPQYDTEAGDYYYEDEDEELHKVIKNDNGEWVEERMEKAHK